MENAEKSVFLYGFPIGKCSKNGTKSEKVPNMERKTEEKGLSRGKRKAGTKIAYTDDINRRSKGEEHMLENIEKVLDKKVRPALLRHEGNVRIADYSDGILKISLTGQCSGCPSARITTEELIKKAVMEEVPEVQDVILVSQTDEELLRLAKELLAGGRMGKN